MVKENASHVWQQVEGSDMQLASYIDALSTWLVVRETICGSSRQVAEHYNPNCQGLKSQHWSLPRAHLPTSADFPAARTCCGSENPAARTPSHCNVFLRLTSCAAGACVAAVTCKRFALADWKAGVDFKR